MQPLNKRAFILASSRVVSFLALGLALLGGAFSCEATTQKNAAPSVFSQLFTDRIMLQGLDKVTGRVFKIETKVGEEVTFEKLRIRVLQCRKAPPEEPPESLAFLEIREDRGNDHFIPIFEGWMFASRPTISGLEHPVYDVWVHECRGNAHPSFSREALSLQSLGITSPMVSQEERARGQDFRDAQPEGTLSFDAVPRGTGTKDSLERETTSSQEIQKEEVQHNQMKAFYTALERVPDTQKQDNRQTP